MPCPVFKSFFKSERWFFFSEESKKVCSRAESVRMVSGEGDPDRMKFVEV
jgi:hypothetical protein